MTRIRIIGLALVAASALSAGGAASASAFTEFVAKPSGQSVTASQSELHTFTIGGASVTCKSAVFTGTAPAEKFTVFEMNPAYSECSAFGFVGSKAKMNECKFAMHITGVVDVKCPTGKEIEIEVNNGGPCIVKIPAQTGLKKLEYVNVTGKNGRASVEAKINIKKIAYTSNRKGVGCPAQAEEATYTGGSVAEGSGTLEVK